MQSQTLKESALAALVHGKNLTFEEIQAYLVQALPHTAQDVFKSGAGLLRAKYFYNLLGNPQDQYKTIHIAGTSGKGSVTHILSHLLAAHEFKVGSFVTPHVYDIRERILLDCKMISKRRFSALATAVAPQIQAMQHSRHGEPSFFEVINGMAFQAFLELKAEYAIVETGLGGLYDSTNTINRSDKLALITALGLDHVAILGDTVEAIAQQKAGIFSETGQALAWLPPEPTVQNTLEVCALNRQTELAYVDARNFTFKETTDEGIVFDYHSASLHIPELHLSLHGKYQAENAALALRALETLAERDGFSVDASKVRRALVNIEIPGRFERIEVFGIQVILDGAHNPQKIAGFAKALQESGIAKADWVFALKDSKDAANILRIISPYVETLYVTGFKSDQEGMFMHSSLPAEELAGIARSCGISKIRVHADNVQALRAACHASKTEPVVVSGSFYLLGDLHSRLTSHV
jgi:dihydrofolate synthase/folylpolyglutamate synthase